MTKLISTNSLGMKVDSITRSFSPRLLNWVEPVDVSGFLKTGIYTEVDSGLKVGDRIFIINGNYDSDLLIQEDKYKGGRDGYKILSIDRCKIVLDIDYTGDLPWNEDTSDDFIRVYNVRDNSEFKYFNRIITTKGGTFSYRFDYYQNNIVYSDTNYSGFLGYGENGGITTASGFFIKNGTSIWTNITSDFLTNSLSSYTSANNDRLMIMNTFIYNNKEFKEGYIYKYENNEWTIDVTYFRPFISKGNFRNGNFKGTWNSGLYGRQDEKIRWEGLNSTWNVGTLLNTIWDQGSINSNFTSKESYFAELDEFGTPFQKINSTNNRGFGYNYIIGSEINTSSISNGNFESTLLGTQSATFSIVEHYLLSWTQSLQININNGEFNNCNFESTLINNAEVKNSRINNSKTNKLKSINSHYKDSIFYGSSFNSDNIIKILKYDEWNLSLDPSSSVDNEYKLYKFYISEKNYKRLKNKDHFYIKGLKVNNNQKEIINYFEKRFILDTYLDYEDGIDYSSSPEIDKKDSLYTVFLSTSSENSHRLIPVIDGSGYYVTTVFDANTNNLPSIDIIVKKSIGYSYVDLSIGEILHGKDFNLLFDTPPLYTSPIYPTEIGNTIDITDAYIIDSDFRSGIVESSKWNSGYYINYGYDNNIINTGSTGGVYDINIPVIGGDKINVNIHLPGIQDNFIKIGDITYLNGIDYDNSSTITRLSEKYKVTNILPSISGRTIELQEILIGTTTSIISGLTGSGSFYTKDAQNRYNYLHRFKINNSEVKSGIFRRSHISDSLIYDQNLKTTDKDFDSLSNVKNLIMSDMLFVGNGNTMSNSTYIYSSVTNGDDVWSNGIFYDSIWNSSTFSNGLIKDSRWVNGSFQDGTFYSSRSFISSNSTYTNYYTENISSYYKDGDVYLSGQRNNRKSWQNGTFNGGEMYKSNWENGSFENGKFYLSNWFNGTFSNGKIGDSKLAPTDTNYYNGIFNNGTVENAKLVSFDSSYLMSLSASIIWNNGVFNSGVFGTDNTSGQTTSAIWNNGTFNGGEFTTNGRWKNGTFNNGKFISEWGWTMSTSTYSTDYSWENGVFNGGEFGNANTATNSTWFNGEFNGGVFKGRIWNNGVITNGEFNGSSTYSSVGGQTCSNASNFTDSFTNSYYGLWRSGTVTDVKDKFIKDKKIFTEIQRVSTEKRPLKSVKIKDSLWISGTFSHPTGEFNNSVWLDGSFEAGTFKSSSFNPYVKRSGSPSQSFNLNDDTCIWKNGSLDNSDFYISKWENGRFLIGTAVGMIWENGISNYMNAFNVFWENGIWRNGNWYGSSFELSGNGEVSDDYVRQILFRGMSWSGTSSCHVWNIFIEETSPTSTIASSSASNVSNISAPPTLPPPTLPTI